MISEVYKYIRVLSLDIVIGAIILLRFFCLEAQVVIDWPVCVLLAIAIWVIYTVDHIRDSQRAERGDRFRYLFHKRNKPALLLVGALLGLIALFLLPKLSSDVLIGGALLSMLSGLYLLLHHRLGKILSKEMFVAAVYSAGILMVPLLHSGFKHWPYFILLFFASFINLMLFSRYERGRDLSDGFESLATKLSEQCMSTVILAVLAVGMSVALLFMNKVGFYFLICFALFFGLFAYPDWFRKQERYRIFGDGIFLLPVFFELL